MSTPTLFSDFQLDSRLMAALADVGYESPSPIQAATIPTLLAGHDVVGLAQTGTGKTAAFALPALQQLNADSEFSEEGTQGGKAQGSKQAATQVLVLAPTRELAIQVAEAFSVYAKYFEDFTVLPIYGGTSYGPQLRGLRRGAQVVVGTPGRVIDHLKKGTLDLSQLSYLVLDEADEMLKMGFAEDVEHILAQTPEEKQVALFSATMPKQIRRIAQQYLEDPQEIAVAAKTTTGENTRQRYVQVMPAYKLDVLTRVLEVEEYDAAIIFVRTKLATEQLAEKLASRGWRAAAINGDIPQASRERTVEALKGGDIDILVATDVAARGLDVERLSLVLNYDIPHDTESYVHRIGRTGRAGRSGEAILFVTPREQRLLRAIEKATRQPVERMSLPSAETINQRREKRFGEQITETLESEELREYRELVAGYTARHDVTDEEVAAALAFMVHGGEGLFVEELPAAAESGARKKRDRERDNVDRGDFRRTDRARADRSGSDRGDSDRGGPRRDNARRGASPHGGGTTRYRIAVGRRHRVQPGAIVGALANEGDLNSSQIGQIDIREDFSLVELPVALSKDQWRSLSRTRISGVPIHLEVDTGPKQRRDHSSRGQGGNREHREYRGQQRDSADRSTRFDGRDDRSGGGGRNGDRSFAGKTKKTAGKKKAKKVKAKKR